MDYTALEQILKQAVRDEKGFDVLKRTLAQDDYSLSPVQHTRGLADWSSELSLLFRYGIDIVTREVERGWMAAAWGGIFEADDGIWLQVFPDPHKDLMYRLTAKTRVSNGELRGASGFGGAAVVLRAAGPERAGVDIFGPQWRQQADAADGRRSDERQR